jgi:Zn-finger nucleic acid-binding protein
MYAHLCVNEPEESRMKCPIDSAELVMSERQGIEIDYCPTCRGVWLDRGELDKIIERASGPVAAQPIVQQGYDKPHGFDDRSYKGSDHRPKKKESFLGQIFDF